MTVGYFEVWLPNYNCLKFKQAAQRNILLFDQLSV